MRRESLQDGVHLALTIFVGFSTETLAIAQQVQSELQPLARAKVWNRGAFKLGEGGLESLVDELARHDFAILVFSPDGITNSRRKYTRSPRDNVIFELGLFMGRLGPRRTFVLYDRTAELKILSDLSGVTLAPYDGKWASTDRPAAIGAACNPIRDAIRRAGPIQKSLAQTPGSRSLSADGLVTRLRNLVMARELRVDIFAYSTETFRSPLEAMFEALKTADHPPKSVNIRVLLKNWKTGLLLPGCARSAEVDPERVNQYRDETRLRHKRTAGEWWVRLKDIQTKKLLPRTRFTVDFRVYDFDPFHKGILINRKQGFWCLYPIKSDVLLDCQGILDYQGKEATFAEFRDDGTESEAHALRAMCEWFDTVWSVCSDDFPTEMARAQISSGYSQ